MGWLADLETAVDLPRPVKKRQPAPKPAVTPFFLQVRPSSGADPGEVEEAYFTVVDDLVTLTDREGFAIQGVKPRTLKVGEAPAAIAHALARAARNSRLGIGGFNRPLSYEANGIA